MLMFVLGIGLIGSSIGGAATYVYLNHSNKVVPKDKYMDCLRELNSLIECYRELKEGEN